MLNPYSIDNNLKEAKKNINKELSKEEILEKFNWSNVELDFCDKVFDNIRNDEDVAIAACSNNINNVKYIGENLKNDKNFIINLIKKSQYGNLLYDINSNLLDDKEVVLIALENKLDTDLISDRLKEDKEIAIKAVRFYSNALVNFKLYQDCEEVISLALEKKYFSLDYNNVSARLRKNKDLMLKAIDSNPYNLEFLDNELKSDLDIVKKALDKKLFTIEHANADVKNNKNFIMPYLEKSNIIFKFLSEELKNDIEVVYKAFVSINDIAVLDFTSEKIKKDLNYIEFVESGRKNKEDFFNHAEKYLKSKIIFNKIEQTVEIKEEKIKKMKI